MEPYRKQLIEKFQRHLQTNFKTYCERHGISETGEELLTYLIDNDLISVPKLQKYTVIKEFETLIQQNHGKTQAVSRLADRFSISPRTVWGILKRIKRRKEA
jgi:hypothetical protein